ncbi:HAL/PAL/TAL family ammonia-lyase [Calidifontibacillus erzurumensis]|uniref:HAL/PAL/TAL family ammonia-lyase n=1 Tax=Calidifontibacillus erzurumensis TaxID=2741433 RepID=UPI001E5926B6|nr:aromatic amino acid ammonia-lyase [Calidifontibacillus erzurumensis]
MESNFLLLDGRSLSIQDIVRIARRRTKVKISDQAMNLLNKGRKLVQQWSEQETPVYGLNRGVGLNKDRPVIDAYSEYNRNLILSHSIGIGPEVPIEEIRAVMATRLNTLLVGCTGIQPEIAKMYETFLNKEITPILPSRGTVGAADIGILSHIGLAMIGEGEVYYKGERVHVLEAFKKEGIQPITLGPKDGLAIVSSNAFSAGMASLLLYDLSDLIEAADMIYALSLEGLNGNVSPLDESVLKVRPYHGQMKSAKRVRKYLENSYLWDETRPIPLQDPLSFRGGFTVHGAVLDCLEYTNSLLTLQLNSSDDNPCVLVDEKRIVPTSNYEVTTLVLGLEMLGLSLAHVSKNSCFRTIKLANPVFTNLSRFLSPDEERVIAFGTIQKTFSALDAEIRHLSNPVSSDYFAIAGEIEDHATNSAFVVQKLKKIVDNLYYILGIEAIHAAQAVDLRKGIQKGIGTNAVYEVIREHIPFLERDRNLSTDIEKAYQLLKSKKLLNHVRKTMRNHSNDIDITL